MLFEKNKIRRINPKMGHRLNRHTQTAEEGQQSRPVDSRQTQSNNKRKRNKKKEITDSLTR